MNGLQTFVYWTNDILFYSFQNFDPYFCMSYSAHKQTNFMMTELLLFLLLRLPTWLEVTSNFSFH